MRHGKKKNSSTAQVFQVGEMVCQRRRGRVRVDYCVLLQLPPPRVIRSGFSGCDQGRHHGVSAPGSAAATSSTIIFFSLRLARIDPPTPRRSPSSWPQSACQFPLERIRGGWRDLESPVAERLAPYNVGAAQCQGWPERTKVSVGGSSSSTQEGWQLI